MEQHTIVQKIIVTMTSYETQRGHLKRASELSKILPDPSAASKSWPGKDNKQGFHTGDLIDMHNQASALMDIVVENLTRIAAKKGISKVEAIAHLPPKVKQQRDEAKAVLLKGIEAAQGDVEGFVNTLELCRAEMLAQMYLSLGK
jgi:hypothetical protein